MDSASPLFLVVSISLAVAVAFAFVWMLGRSRGPDERRAPSVHEPVREPVHEPVPPAASAAAYDTAAILERYFALVASTDRQLAVDATTLPLPKERLRPILREALRGEVATSASPDVVRHAWMRLASFQPGPLDLPGPSDVPKDWTSIPPSELRSLLITVRNDRVADLLIRVEIEEKRLARELDGV